MRSGEEVHAHLVSMLGPMFSRPGMWGNGTGLEILIRHILKELAFVEGTEEKLAFELAGFEHQGLWGPPGVWGIMKEILPRVPRVDDEITSIYAELACRFGWLKPERLLALEAWTEVEQFITVGDFDYDWRLSEVRTKFGEPSFRCLHHIDAYACEDISKGWIYFDYAGDAPKESDEDRRLVRVEDGGDHYLRNCRTSYGKLKENLRFTPFGMQYV